MNAQLNPVPVHTRGPWSVKIVVDHLRNQQFYVVGTDDRRIADTGYKPDAAACFANARRIVTAVNNHEALVEALEMVRDADNDCRRDDLPTMPRLARDKIDRLLAEVAR